MTVSSTTKDGKGQLDRSARTRFRRLAHMLAPHWKRLLIATIALMVGSGISLIYPQAVRYAIDDGRMEILHQIVLGLFVAFLLQAVLTWVRHYYVTWLGYRAVADFRRQAFERLLRQPPSFFHQRSVGELVGRLASDVETIQSIVGSDLSLALRNGLTMLGGVTLLFIENPTLTLLMLAVIPPASLGILFGGRMLRRGSRRVQDRAAQASARVNEALSAVETVQGFGREQDESNRYQRSVEETFEAGRRLAVWRGGYMGAVSLVGFGAITIVLWYGGYQVASGEITGGDLAAFMLYTSMVTVSMASLANLYGALQRAAGATDRLFEIIDAEPTIQSPQAPETLPPGPLHIRFEHVSHQYPSRPDVTVLENINLDIHPGETVAIVGPSGSGKTTLKRLLQRFYDPSAGEITMNGIRLDALDLHDVRTQLGSVEQEAPLFSGTLLENIAYAHPDAAQETIEKAARRAQIHNFIANLPQGYLTEIGERGITLSGGQRQRIALARLLVADPPLLVFDEATSHLDAENESAIQAALEEVLADRSAVIIAHRLSTIRHADRIVVLDQGQIAEEGSHQELMQKDGVYRKLVELQHFAPDIVSEMTLSDDSSTVRA